MSRKKPKQNQAQDTSKSDLRDRCETPGYALDPLLPFLHPSWRIWEPACGSGRIVRKLEANNYTVQGSDLLYGNNFFTELPPAPFDAIVTNPPYSIKPQWIKRCYELLKPFALLVPVETIGSGAVQKLMEEYGAAIMLMNRRVNFYMPIKGLKGNGAQFPVLWFTWGMLPAPVVYGKFTYYADEQMSLFDLPPAARLEYKAMSFDELLELERQEEEEAVYAGASD